MMITVYRVITENGYTEFLEQAAAEVFAQGREIEVITKQIPENNA